MKTLLNQLFQTIISILPNILDQLSEAEKKRVEEEKLDELIKHQHERFKRSWEYTEY